MAFTRTPGDRSRRRRKNFLGRMRKQRIHTTMKDLRYWTARRRSRRRACYTPKKVHIVRVPTVDELPLLEDFIAMEGMSVFRKETITRLAWNAQLGRTTTALRNVAHMMRERAAAAETTGSTPPRDESSVYAKGEPPPPPYGPVLPEMFG